MSEQHSNAARRLWTLLEPIHAVIYFADETLTAGSAAGLRGFWMTYFAFRFAPIGPVGPAVATAACYGFAPSRVERALPDAWSWTAPEQALRARATAATAALRRILTDASGDAGSTHLSAAADLAWRAAQFADTGGRLLAAANQALNRPTDPLTAVWQATTTLREQRGDGHNAVLLAAGIDPVQAHWLKIGAGETDQEALRISRDWDENVWALGKSDLQTRGLLDDDGLLTDAGCSIHDKIEAQTDTTARSPWARLEDQDTESLAQHLGPISQAVIESGILPFPNPIGFT